MTLHYLAPRTHELAAERLSCHHPDALIELLLLGPEQHTEPSADEAD